MTNITFSNNSSHTTLKSRLNASVMYSRDGALWQEHALAILDRRGSIAHKAIGRLVTAINNKRLTVQQAETEYLDLLNR